MTVTPGKEEFSQVLERPEHLVRASQAGGYGRGGALAFTIGLHVVAVLALIAGLHAAHTLPVREIVAKIDVVKKKIEVVPPPSPQFVRPPEVVITVPPPVVIQTVLPPAHVDAPRAVVAPPAPQTGVGEGRDSFLARLLSQLNRFKHYPPGARKAHIEGVVMVHFVMDAGGSVQLAEIAKSSGRLVLDNEALALIRRAQPLPALPPDFPNNSLDAVVPIEFNLH